MYQAKDKKKPFEIIDNLYIRCDPAVRCIDSESDFLDLLGYLYQIRKIVIFQSNLNSDFFDLSTGFAGTILQKIVNYSVNAAFIVDLESIKSKYFKEMAMEADGRTDFRFFKSEDDAVKWLVH